MNKREKGWGIILALFCFFCLFVLIVTQTKWKAKESAMGSTNIDGDEGELAKYSAKTAWSKSGTLTTLDPAKRKEFLQADFSRAGQYTVQFLVARVPRPNALFRQRAKAVITWSVEGNFVQRQVSIYDGVSVSGVGQAVKVEMSDDSVSIAGGSDKNQPYDISCQVALGSRPSQQQPPNYQVEVQSVGAVTLFALPQNIGAISTFIQPASDLVATSVQVVVLDAAGSGLQFWTMEKTSVPVWRPLPPGAASLQFTRSSGIGSDRYAVFIGIDG